LIQLTIPFSGVAGSWVGCQPIVDGSWAGSSSFPALAGKLTKEGAISIGFNAANKVWSIARIYDGVAAGLHEFAAQCWANGSVTFGAGLEPALASMTVIEIR
jgi:hypothetical protein